MTNENYPGCQVRRRRRRLGTAREPRAAQAWSAVSNSPLYFALVVHPPLQHKMLIINAPFWFSGAWGGVKNVMPKETREAACVRSTNYLGELTKHIDLEQIPREYGGSR